MSNPVATIDNFVPHPGDPNVVRRTFTRLSFESQAFFNYGENDYDPTYGGVVFDPSDKGEHYYLWVPMEYALGGIPSGAAATRPDFISAEAWDNFRWAPSGFVQGAANSVLPKIIVPSELLVDNGLFDVVPWRADVWDDGAAVPAEKDLFNWEMMTFNGAAIISDFQDYGHSGDFFGSQYITIGAKDDDRINNEIQIRVQTPQLPLVPPLGSDHDFLAADSSNIVVGGAFCLVLNVVPETAGTASPREVAKNPWQIEFQFGDVKMILSAGSEMRVRISGGNAADDWVTVNMVDGKSKGGPPQQEHMSDKSPYVIMVYPVWNGIIVASGAQESRTNSRLTTPTLASSTYVPKLKDVSIWEAPYSAGFDPTAPADVEVDVDSGGSGDVTVDFGTHLYAIAQNCRFELAYLPCFFSKEMWIDEWFVTSDDIPGDVSFDYGVYPIWTANNGASVLSPAPTVIESTTLGPVADTHYSYIKWRLSQDSFDRIPGQIFGEILEVEETRQFAVRNDNGNFTLTWAGGTPGDPTPGGWKDHVQSISVNTNLEGSGGSCVVDKYGVAGQEAEAFQEIGAFTIDMDGGFGTESGSIFKGLAMGVADNRSATGAMWSIPLVGLEKKMDDIALINVPFMDGETLATALNFMTKYAGIVSNMAAATPGIQLSVSEDINVARFDWKSGTSVRTAIEDCMKDTNHAYVVQQGEIQFYQLDNNGLPLILGFDWKPNYPDTKTVVVDQTPDFEDLRNEIVVIGLEEIFAGQNTNSESIPTIPRFERRENITTPNVPWARSIVELTPGFLELTEIEDYADRIARRTNHYETLGRTSIPGNANIHIYDRWGSAVIYSITHNVDLQAKSWTTDLEFSAI